MKMTIAEPIQTLEYLRDSGAFPFSTKEGVLYTAESIDVVIDTMHKYQKIVQIMERTVDDGTSMYDTLQEIEEVIEDGNDN